MSLDDTPQSQHHSTVAERPGRGMNRVDPAVVARVLQAVVNAGQCPYAMGSALPPHPHPGDRWPMLGPNLSQRVMQLATWLTSPTRTGAGSLPAAVRREVTRFLDEQGLEDVGPQDLMRCLASLSTEPVSPQNLKRMCRLMSNDRRYEKLPDYSLGASSERNLRLIRQRIRAGDMPRFWARYALRVVANALALPLDARSLWLLRHALQRAAQDVSLYAHPSMAPAAALLRRQWSVLLQELAPTLGRPLPASEWKSLQRLWNQQDPLFNPLRHSDSPEPKHLRLWMAAQVVWARQRPDKELEARLKIWPEDFADHAQAWAYAVARELLDGTRTLDFSLDETGLRLPALPQGQGPMAGEPNALHHLAATLRAKRARKGDALHQAPDAALQDALRCQHHTHFRYLADHLPRPTLRTAPAGQDVATSR